MKTKHIFSLGLITLLFIPQLLSQGFDGKMRWVIGLGMQQQDRRMFDWPKSYAQELIDADGGMPTMQFSLGISKPILYRQDFSIDLGIGYGLEINSFTRPFNRVPLLDNPISVPSDIVFVGGYFIHMGSTSLSFSKRLWELPNGGRVFFSCDAIGSANWLKWMRAKGTTFYLFQAYREKKVLFNPYSVEINPGLGFEKNAFRITINYRLWQIKQVDPVLFAPILYHSLPLDPYDTYNPFKMWITVSRDLEDGWWRKEQWPKGRGK